MKNSSDSPRSDARELFLVGLALCVLSALAAGFFYSHNYLLYYGDAQAHLNASRSWIDSRTPGYEQIGTVWLPLLHLLCLPFVSNNFLWHTGLAGTLPVAACFVSAGICLYLCAKEVYLTAPAAIVVLACFALNPNILYLASIPMTELVFIAGLAACLLCILRFRRTYRRHYLLLAVFASWWMSLTRYDGWFLMPFIAALLSNRKIANFLAIGAACALAPLYWLAHDWWSTSNALDFYNGPYSAAAIQAYKPYPGLHDWPAAIHYYLSASLACSGWTLFVVGLAGIFVAMLHGKGLPVFFLALTPLFYIWSIHGSWTPIFVPNLWPHGYYNTRYGIATVVLFAFSVGSLVTLSKKWNALVAAICVLPWLVAPNPEHWICWKESQVNSDARRAWTKDAAKFFNENYRHGDGILVQFGDLAGIFCKAEIPLKQAVHEGNGPAWLLNTTPRGLVQQTKWAIAQRDDRLFHVLDHDSRFHVVDTIRVKGAPDLFIYERN